MTSERRDLYLSLAIWFIFASCLRLRLLSRHWNLVASRRFLAKVFAGEGFSIIMMLGVGLV